MIILHGRGSIAERFADPLLTHPVAPLSTAATSDAASSTEPMRAFQDYFPNTKFVFPTAPLRRAVAFNRSLTHQWFDHWSHKEPEVKQHLQVTGLRETSAFLHGLLKQEIDTVGASNVVLMGLSQGCAASIIATLLWEGESFGALVGMCGYLPFCRGMRDFVVDGVNDGIKLENEDDVEDIFERVDEDPRHGTRLERAVEWLREELQVSKEGEKRTEPPTIRSIPVFMGHGAEDVQVPYETGRLAAETLRVVDVDVAWQGYEGLGHWYSEEMLRDVVRFLKALKGREQSNQTNLE
ncbi:hypothetical protein N0V90_011676 [Kalmusia sp. IMI 367209]|nr:hypothetical protein N0V90_011676 [Kalmusia sp. IMI 367209]